MKGSDDDGSSVPAGDAKRRGKSSEPSPPGRPGWSKNPAFEDLCGIYENGFTDRHAARRWLSRYVLGRTRPDRANSKLESTDARHWALADLFLKEVLTMKSARIDAIRAFADKLATWIQSKNDKGLYRSLIMDKPNELRRTLMRAQRHSTSSDSILFGLDEFATVWLHEDGDEWLVRDLVCIRAIETLEARGFFKANTDMLPEEIGTGEESLQ